MNDNGASLWGICRGLSQRARDNAVGGLRHDMKKMDGFNFMDTGPLSLEDRRFAS